MDKRRFRLLTKCDLDGLACGLLLKEMDLIDRLAFAHPKEIENGTVEVTANDITAGLPYRQTAHLAFDHYPGALATGSREENLVVDQRMPSTARVIYRHYGHQHFPYVSHGMLSAVEKATSGLVDSNDILYPNGWMLLGHLLDHRTGLERFQQLSISTSELMATLLDYCRDHAILEILNLPGVEERLNLYFSCVERCKTQVLRCATVYRNLVVIDMRKEKVIYPGNRFMAYALFPECNVSLQVTAESDGSSKTAFVAGKSVLDRSYSKDIGKILTRYGGGGHANAGSCQAADHQADTIFVKLIGELKYGNWQNLLLGYFNDYQYQSTHPIPLER